MKTHDFVKDRKFANQKWKGVISKKKTALLTRTCPPGLAKVGPDMTEVRVLVQFCTFRIQNKVFDEIYKRFCVAFVGEAQKTK